MTNQPTTALPVDFEALKDFLSRAELDACARAGDPFDRTPLTIAFAETELALIARLRDLVAADEQSRAFVRRWRSLVETASPDDYPQRRGVRFPPIGGVQWTIGAQQLRCAVTLWDAFVRDEIVKTYRVLGSVVAE